MSCERCDEKYGHECHDCLTADRARLAAENEALRRESEGRLRVLNEKGEEARREWIRAERAESALAAERARVKVLEAFTRDVATRCPGCFRPMKGHVPGPPCPPASPPSRAIALSHQLFGMGREALHLIEQAHNALAPPAIQPVPMEPWNAPGYESMREAPPASPSDDTQAAGTRAGTAPCGCGAPAAHEDVGAFGMVLGCCGRGECCVSAPPLAIDGRYDCRALAHGKEAGRGR